MKNSFRKFILAAAMLCLMCTGAFAEMGDSITEEGFTNDADVSLNLDVSFDYAPAGSEDEEFRFVLTPVDDNNPMPGGATGGSTSVAVSGDLKGMFDSIKFDRVGIYEYTIEQVTGANSNIVYDDTVYNVVITVVNSDNGAGFVSNTIIYSDDNQHKEGSLDFDNVFITPEPGKETPPPPGEVTDTGVRDTWYLYLIGAMGMMAFAAVAIKVLREKNEEEAQPEAAGITDKDLAELAEDLDANFYEDENDKK